MNFPQPINLDSKEIQALIERIENRQMRDSDYEHAHQVVTFMTWLPSALKKGKVSLRRLRSLVGVLPR